MRSRLCVLLVSALLTACTGSGDYLIKGSSKDFADGSKVYLFYSDAGDEPVFIDSAMCEKNSFAFSGVVDTLKMAAVVVASIDDDRSAWLDVVKDSSQWQNVLAGKDVRDMYGVGGVPTHFLIDCSTGKIVVADTWTHRTLNWRDEIVRLFEIDMK